MTVGSGDREDPPLSLFRGRTLTLGSPVFPHLHTQGARCVPLALQTCQADEVTQVQREGLLPGSLQSARKAKRPLPYKP